MAELHWVETEGPGRLAILPHPWGGEWLKDEVRTFLREGVQVVVSCLEPHEEKDLFLAGEADAFRQSGLEYLSYPIRDHDVPKDEPRTDAFILEVAQRFRSGKAVAVHCRAGIGRSGTIAACVLLESGLPKEEVFRRLEAARGFPIPGTPEQWDWVERYARRREP